MPHWLTRQTFGSKVSFRVPIENSLILREQPQNITGPNKFSVYSLRKLTGLVHLL